MVAQTRIVFGGEEMGDKAVGGFIVPFVCDNFGNLVFEQNARVFDGDGNVGSNSCDDDYLGAARKD